MSVQFLINLGCDEAIRLGLNCGDAMREAAPLAHGQAAAGAAGIADDPTVEKLEEAEAEEAAALEGTAVPTLEDAERENADAALDTAGAVAANLGGSLLAGRGDEKSENAAAEGALGGTSAADARHEKTENAGEEDSKKTDLEYSGGPFAAVLPGGSAPVEEKPKTTEGAEGKDVPYIGAADEEEGNEVTGARADVEGAEAVAEAVVITQETPISLALLKPLPKMMPLGLTLRSK